MVRELRVGVLGYFSLVRQRVLRLGGQEVRLMVRVVDMFLPARSRVLG